MKTATASIMAVCIVCPECGSAVAAPTNGSEMLTPEDIAALKLRAGAVHECESCGERFRVPAVVAKM